jgi:hypothetical protein
MPQRPPSTTKAKSDFRQSACNFNVSELPTHNICREFKKPSFFQYSKNICKIQIIYSSQNTSSRKSGFDPRSDRVAFVLDNVVMRQFYLQVHRLYCVNIVPPIVHAHSFITKSHLTSASDIVVKHHSLKKKTFFVVSIGLTTKCGYVQPLAETDQWQRLKEDRRLKPNEFRRRKQINLRYLSAKTVARYKYTAEQKKIMWFLTSHISI